MIAVQQVDQIEVFVNQAGGISIRQGDERDEILVVFQPEHADAVIKAIRAAAKEARELRVEEAKEG